jgi:hypothetical protein
MLYIMMIKVLTNSGLMSCLMKWTQFVSTDEILEELERSGPRGLERLILGELHVAGRAGGVRQAPSGDIEGLC